MFMTLEHLCLKSILGHQILRTDSRATVPENGSQQASVKIHPLNWYSENKCFIKDKITINLIDCRTLRFWYT